MNYGLVFFAAFVLTYLYLPIAFNFSRRLKAIDKPGGRRVHKTAIPRLGGLAIVLSLMTVTFLTSTHENLTALLIPAAILLLVGLYDDIYGLSALKKLFFQSIAAFIAVAMGITAGAVSSPLGGAVDLSVFSYLGISLGQFLSFVWIIFMINVVNLMDGLDGLAAGVSGIAGLVLFVLSLTLGQPELALLFIILAGSTLGFLPKNFHPAKIFMGDSGAMVIGYLLGALSIISGAKIAAAALVIGFPVLDFFWSILRRFSRGGIARVFKPDKEHIHHLLLDAGLSHRQVVVFFYIVSALFGAFALVGETKTKLAAFSGLVLLMIGVLGAVYFKIKRRQPKTRA